MAEPTSPASAAFWDERYRSGGDRWELGVAAPALASLLQDPQTHFYVCGLKSMEEGVLQALRAIALDAGLDWPLIAEQLKAQGRLQLETY